MKQNAVEFATKVVSCSLMAQSISATDVTYGREICGASETCDLVSIQLCIHTLIEAKATC